MGVTEAKPGQCDDRSRMQKLKDKMKDKITDMMGMDKDGKLTMMDSATRLATTALAAASISMTLYWNYFKLISEIGYNKREQLL